MHYNTYNHNQKDVKMGFRFRKSVNLGPFRVNASKTGLGWSFGVPGARYTKMANGRNRVTASIPGTGISWVEESKKQPKESEESESADWTVILDILVAVLAVVGIVVLAILEAASKKGLK